MNVNFPFRFDGRGRTAEAAPDEHVRDLMEQVIFTSPGERINRPTFGSGLLQLAFAPNSEELGAATQFLIQGALHQWLGELIQVQEVSVESEGEALRVTVEYVVRRTGAREVAQFVRGEAGL